jgi:hypothetical protein
MRIVELVCARNTAIPVGYLYKLVSSCPKHPCQLRWKVIGHVSKGTFTIGSDIQRATSCVGIGLNLWEELVGFNSASMVSLLGTETDMDTKAGLVGQPHARIHLARVVKCTLEIESTFELYLELSLSAELTT